MWAEETVSFPFLLHVFSSCFFPLKCTSLRQKRGERVKGVEGREILLLGILHSGSCQHSAGFSRGREKSVGLHCILLLFNLWWQTDMVIGNRERLGIRFGLLTAPDGLTGPWFGCFGTCRREREREIIMVTAWYVEIIMGLSTTATSMTIRIVTQYEKSCYTELMMICPFLP